MATRLSQFLSFLSGNAELDRVQKNISLALDPVVKLLLSWKLALTEDGWLQHDGKDVVSRLYAVYTNASQSIPNNSATIVNFSTKVMDPKAAVSAGASWRFSVPAGFAGLYLVSATVLLGSATGFMYLNLYRNGVNTSLLGAQYVSANVNGVSGSALIQLNDGDYIDVRAHQITGGAVSTSAIGADNHINILRLGTDL